MGRNIPFSVPKSFKNCAVCNFWGGVRKVDSFGRNAIVESMVAKGKCLNQGGNCKGVEMQAGSKCNKWVAWGVLK